MEVFTDVVTVCSCNKCNKHFFVPEGIENYNKKLQPTVDGVNCPYGCKESTIEFVGETKII